MQDHLIGGDMVENKKILSFSIGPVQGFIAQARKTKDLFSGSKILSDIIDHVLKEFKNEQIIFPHKDLESKPNRFIAIIDGGSQAKDIAGKVEKLARRKFMEIAETTYFNVFGNLDMPNGFKEQVNDFLDINWIAIDYDEHRYKDIHNELDMLMGAVKNTRIYKQIRITDSEIGEAGKKCSVCGERNSLFFKKPPRSCNSSQYRVVNDYFISENESICGVCFVKRYYEKEKVDSFPSTAEICLMNVLSKLNMNMTVIDDEEINQFGNFTVDVLFEENNNIEYIKENGMLKKEVSLTEEKRLLKKLNDIERNVTEKAKKEGLKLSKYYAIISFDGDGMGKWLSGEKIDESKCTLLDFHKTLSKLLGEFSQKAKEIVVEPWGKIVYAGGEDFLGFINIEYLFDVMLSLRILFDTVVNKPLKKYAKKEDDNLTFSAGISISHYKISLSNSIKWAKMMEKKAKKIDGKNSFAIALLKRSGDGKIAKFRWQEDSSNEFTIINDIKNVICNLKDGYFSDTFIYTLGDTLFKLPSSDYDWERMEEKETVDNMIQSEIYRLVKRSFNGEEMESINEKIDEMVNSLVNIYNRSNVGDIYTGYKDNFMDLLYILAFLVREVYYDNRN